MKQVTTVVTWGIVFLALLSFLVLAAILLFYGGMLKVWAWYMLFFIPLFSILLILGQAWRLIRKRPRVRRDNVALVMMLLCLLPLALWTNKVTYPASWEKTEPIATVRLPSDLPLKVAWGGDSVRVNYHAAVPDQRWAYDLVVDPYFTESSNLTDYGCFGTPIVAPASGAVVVAEDGHPDVPPGLPSNPTNPAGNYVAIELKTTNTYLLIAHLKEGSVLVHEGDFVEEGQIVGQCGNSGNTSEPHIHIHHQRQNPADYPIGFAEGLPLAFRDTNGDSRPKGGIEEVDGEIVLTGSVVQHQP